MLRDREETETFHRKSKNRADSQSIFKIVKYSRLYSLSIMFCVTAKLFVFDCPAS